MRDEDLRELERAAPTHPLHAYRWRCALVRAGRAAEAGLYRGDVVAIPGWTRDPLVRPHLFEPGSLEEIRRQVDHWVSPPTVLPPGRARVTALSGDDSGLKPWQLDRYAGEVAPFDHLSARAGAWTKLREWFAAADDVAERGEAEELLFVARPLPTRRSASLEEALTWATSPVT